VISVNKGNISDVKIPVIQTEDAADPNIQKISSAEENTEKVSSQSKFSHAVTAMPNSDLEPRDAKKCFPMRQKLGL
jgi:hypothetical protein